MTQIRIRPELPITMFIRDFIQSFILGYPMDILSHPIDTFHCQAVSQITITKPEGLHNKPIIHACEVINV